MPKTSEEKSAGGRRSRSGEAGREPAAAFYARLAKDCGSDLDLEIVIRESRKTDPGPEL